MATDPERSAGRRPQAGKGLRGKGQQSRSSLVTVDIRRPCPRPHSPNFPALFSLNREPSLMYRLTICTERCPVWFARTALGPCDSRASGVAGIFQKKGPGIGANGAQCGNCNQKDVTIAPMHC